MVIALCHPVVSPTPPPPHTHSTLISKDQDAAASTTTTTTTDGGIYDALAAQKEQRKQQKTQQTQQTQQQQQKTQQTQQQQAFDPFTERVNNAFAVVQANAAAATQPWEHTAKTSGGVTGGVQAAQQIATLTQTGMEAGNGAAKTGITHRLGLRRRKRRQSDGAWSAWFFVGVGGLWVMCVYFACSVCAVCILHAVWRCPTCVDTHTPCIHTQTPLVMQWTLIKMQLLLQPHNSNNARYYVFTRVGCLLCVFACIVNMHIVQVHNPRTHPCIHTSNSLCMHRVGRCCFQQQQQQQGHRQQQR